MSICNFAWQRDQRLEEEMTEQCQAKRDDRRDEGRSEEQETGMTGDQEMEGMEGMEGQPAAVVMDRMSTLPWGMNVCVRAVEIPQDKDIYELHVYVLKISCMINPEVIRR